MLKQEGREGGRGKEKPQEERDREDRKRKGRGRKGKSKTERRPGNNWGKGEDAGCHLAEPKGKQRGALTSQDHFIDV